MSSTSSFVRRLTARKGAPSVFDSQEAETDQRAPVMAMALESSRVLEGGAMLLRYQIQNAVAADVAR